MKLIDAPYNTLLSFRYGSGVENIYLIGKAYNQKDKYVVPLVGLKKASFSMYANKVENLNDSYFKDDGTYVGTYLYFDIKTIRKEFYFCRWLDGYADKECFLINTYANQKCSICELPAPHLPPNLVDKFVCKVCITLSQLDNNSH